MLTNVKRCWYSPLDSNDKNVLLAGVFALVFLIGGMPGIGPKGSFNKTSGQDLVSPDSGSLVATIRQYRSGQVITQSNWPEPRAFSSALFRLNTKSFSFLLTGYNPLSRLGLLLLFGRLQL